MTKFDVVLPLTGAAVGVALSTLAIVLLIEAVRRIHRRRSS